jgi:streptogramin lyase
MGAFFGTRRHKLNYGKQASGNINPSCFVKLDPANSDRVLQCGVGDTPWGISQSATHLPPLAGVDDGLAAVAGEWLDVYGPQNSTRCDLRVSAPVFPGVQLKPDVNGYGTPVTSTADVFGAISQAAAQANRIVPVMPVFSSKSFLSPELPLSLVPNSCYLSGSDYIVITASGGLSSTTAVTFGGIPAKYLSIKSDIEIHVGCFAVPSAGTVTVVVTTGSGTKTGTFAFLSNAIAGTQTLFQQAGQFGFTGPCTGPDLNLWWGDNAGHAWTMKTDGTGAASYALAGANVVQTICGPDGNVWCLDANGKVWKVPTSGSGITSYSLAGAVLPSAICIGPDGNLWATDSGSDNFWRVTPAGTVTSFTTPATVTLWGITGAPDGNLYATYYDSSINKSGFLAISTAGAILQTYQLTILTVHAPILHQTSCDSLGNLWTSSWTDATGKFLFLSTISSPASVTAVSFPNTSGSTVLGPCFGPDANIYASTHQPSVPANTLYQCNASGILAMYPITNPSPSINTADGPQGCCTGSDGSVWFAYRTFSGDSAPSGLIRLR